jgi:ankyrin repeat protein
MDVTLSGSSPYLVSIGQFSITSPDISQLNAAVELEDVGQITSLISKHHNVNQRELPSERTALYMAVAGAKNKSLQTLLDLGADPNIPDYKGDMPLDVAIATNNSKATDVLVRAGAKRK